MRHPPDRVPHTTALTTPPRGRLVPPGPARPPALPHLGLPLEVAELRRLCPPGRDTAEGGEGGEGRPPPPSSRRLRLAGPRGGGGHAAVPQQRSAAGQGRARAAGPGSGPARQRPERNRPPRGKLREPRQSGAKPGSGTGSPQQRGSGPPQPAACPDPASPGGGAGGERAARPEGSTNPEIPPSSVAKVNKSRAQGTAPTGTRALRSSGVSLACSGTGFRVLGSTRWTSLCPGHTRSQRVSISRA